MVVLEKGQFERLAGLIAERTAELLLTRVWITDGRGVVIAGNEPGAGGTSFDAVDRRSNVHYLRVPLRQGLESGEVIIAEPGTGESVSPRLAQVLVELIIDQASLIDRLPNKHELKAKFVHDLLHDTVRDEDALCREAQVLGMDLTCPRAVMLIDAAEYISGGIHGDRFDPSDARIRRRAQLLIGRIVDFFELPNDTICTYIGEGEVVVLKAVNRITWVDQDDVMERADQSWINLNALKKASVALLFRLRSDTRTAISLGIGRYHRGLHGLSRSYQDARAALSLGQRFHGHNQVHCLDSLGIAAFVGIADERTKVDLAQYLLSPLDHDADLLDTLRTFFALDCLPSLVARRLDIHRNTLSYRLEKIASLTGLDPRRFDDAVQIRLALALRSLPH